MDEIIYSIIVQSNRRLGTMKQQKMYTQEELDTARQEGYDSGYDNGYGHGWDTGFDSGKMGN